jgi:hypothetical protein
MRKFLIALTLFGLFGIPALAQDIPMGEVYGGYQFSRHPAGVDGDVPYDAYLLHGFLTSFEGNVKPYLGVVGEFGYNRKTWDNNWTETFDTFLFGPRFSYRKDKFRVFGHYLIGAIRYASPAGNDTNFGSALGGGVDFPVGQRFSIRPAQLDVVSIKWSNAGISEWENEFRYSVGFVVKFGSR